MASSNEKEYTVTVTETKTWRVKINASSSKQAEEIVCERHGPIENKTEAEYEAVFGGAEILDRDWDIKTCADAERCDNCGETEDLIITEDVVTCEVCDPACYKCEYRSWKWSIEVCERLDEASGWNMGLYCWKCIEESETVEGDNTALALASSKANWTAIVPARAPPPPPPSPVTCALCALKAEVGTITVCGRDMVVCENCDKGGDGYNGFLDEYDFCAETSSYEEKAVVETVISDDNIDLFDGDKLDDALENDNADWSFDKPTHTKDFMTIYIFPKEEEHEEK